MHACASSLAEQALSRAVYADCGSELPWHRCLGAGLPDKISWVEKFVEVGRSASEAAKAEHER